MLFTCFPKNINKLFRHKILFWCSIILFLSTWNTFLGNIKFFCWHGAPFHAASTCFCRYQITFCATLNILSGHKNVFCATLKFCFGHRLECYVMVIYFYNQVLKKIKLHFWVTQILLFVHYKFIIFKFYIAHWQRSGPRNKDIFIPSFTHQPVIFVDVCKQVTKIYPGKKVF